MPKVATGRSGPPTAAKQPPSQDDAGLRSEIAAFASSLGLSSGGGTPGGGFDDSDFRPEKAKQLLSTPAPERKRSAPEQPAGGRTNDRDSKKPRATTGVKGLTSGGSRDAETPSGNRGPSKEVMDAIKSRAWNSGAGSRPDSMPNATAKPGRRSLLRKDEPALWYAAAAAFPDLEAPTGSNQQQPDDVLVEAKRAEAEIALERETELFEADMGRKGGQDARWLQQVRRSGTTADKVAANSLVIQESAVANMKSLDAMLNMVVKRKGGRAVVGQAIEALREVFLAALLPDRKLRFLSQQPLASLPNSREGERRLLYWHLEDCIKKRYAMFLTALEECSRDNLDFIKERSLRALSELLRRKPEGEAALLTGIVNKLGDPSRKLASKAGYLLGEVLTEHPGMKLVVVREVERFMFRPGLQERARYYAVIFLNQLVLSHQESHGGSALAEKVIGIYFAVFQLIMKGEIGHAAELKKAIAIKEEEAKKQHGPKKGRGKKPRRGLPDKKGRGKPKGPPAGDGPALPEAFQAGDEGVDARMLSALIAGVRRAFPYVAPEAVEPLIEEHSAALFRVCHTASFGVAVQGLMLLFQLMAARNSVSDRFYRALYAVLLSPEVPRTNKAPMFLALLFKAMRADVSSRRVAAFVKRLLQVSSSGTSNFAAGSLFLVSELLKAKPSLWSSILQPEDGADDNEHFADAPDTDAQPSNGESAVSKAAGGNSDADEPTDTAAAEKASVAIAAADVPWPPKGDYDMRKREPAFCGAERACLWELCVLAEHVHPSVVAMARTLLAGATIVYEGDPLRDLTLSAFLDKFVQKKPKGQARGSSLMQPAGARLPSKASAAGLAFGDEAFRSLAEADVEPSEVFFHKYYSLAAQRSKPVKKIKRKAGSDDEDADESDGSSDSEADMDDFMAGEEEEGEEGIGANPDEDYDYSALADAMDGSDNDSASDSDSDESAPSDDDAELDPAGADARAKAEEAAEIDALDPFSLASATDSSADGSGPEGSESESDSDGDDMLGVESGSSSEDEDDRRMGMNAFASADDWEDRIQQDIATEGIKPAAAKRRPPPVRKPKGAAKAEEPKKKKKSQPRR